MEDFDLCDENWEQSCESEEESEPNPEPAPTANLPPQITNVIVSNSVINIGQPQNDFFEGDNAGGGEIPYLDPEVAMGGYQAHPLTQTSTDPDTGVETRYGNLQGGRMSISKTITEEIGPGVGRVSVGGCTVDFPEGSSSGEKPVSVTAEIDSSKLPRNFSAFTPTLYVDAGDFLGKAHVKLPSWRISGPEGRGEVLIIHKPQGSDEWQNTGITLPVTDVPYFEFDWGDFSPVVAGAFVATDDDYRISGAIYASNRNEVSIVFYINDGTRNEPDSMACEWVERRMNSSTPPKDFKTSVNALRARPHGTVETTIECSFDIFRFFPPGPFSFRATRDVFNDGYYIHSTTVQPAQLVQNFTLPSSIGVAGKVECNGESRGFGFNMEPFFPKRDDEDLLARGGPRSQRGNQDGTHPGRNFCAQDELRVQLADASQQVRYGPIVIPQPAQPQLASPTPQTAPHCFSGQDIFAAVTLPVDVRTLGSPQQWNVRPAGWLAAPQNSLGACSSQPVSPRSMTCLPGGLGVGSAGASRQVRLAPAIPQQASQHSQRAGYSPATITRCPGQFGPMTIGGPQQVNLQPAGITQLSTPRSSGGGQPVFPSSMMSMPGQYGSMTIGGPQQADLHPAGMQQLRSPQNDGNAISGQPVSPNSMENSPGPVDSESTAVTSASQVILPSNVILPRHLRQYETDTKEVRETPKP